MLLKSYFILQFAAVMLMFYFILYQECNPPFTVLSLEYFRHMLLVNRKSICVITFVNICTFEHLVTGRLIPVGGQLGNS